MVPTDLEQAVEEGRSAPHLVFRVKTFEVEHGRDAMNASPLAGHLQRALGVVLGLDHEMAEALGQGDEIAFGIDDGLLHPGRALFQQPAQQVRLAGAGIALDEEAGRQQFLEVQGGRRSRRRLPHLDRNGHVPRLKRASRGPAA